MPSGRKSITRSHVFSFKDHSLLWIPACAGMTVAKAPNLSCRSDAGENPVFVGARSIVSPLGFRLAILCMLLAFCPALALAQADKPTVSRAAHQKLGAAQTLLLQENWTQADAVLAEVVREFAHEPYALALAWRMRGFLFNETGRPEKALEAFDKALELDSLDNASRLQVLADTAQMLVLLERHDDAARRMSAWLDQIDIVSPQQRVRAAWIFYEAGRYDTAALHLKAAVQETKQAGSRPRDEWYDMLLAALYHGGQYEELIRQLLEVMEQRPTDKRYWQQLAAAQLAATHLGLNRERQAAAVLAAGYHKGVFDQPEDLVQAAQMLRQAKAPHLGARILEQALSDGRIPATAQNLDLLADTWLQAREIQKAAAVLIQKIAHGEDCATRLRIGRLFMQIEDWSAAAQHLEHAAGAGCAVVRPDALLLLGMARYHQGRLEEARATFAQARQEPKVRRQAEIWLEGIRSGE